MKSDLANFTDTVVITIDHSDTTGKTDTLKFTRNVNKVRTAVYHFRNVIYRPLDPIHFLFRYVASSDTISYIGTVTGIDEKGDAYSKLLLLRLW
jgi:hypothetical protein